LWCDLQHFLGRTGAFNRTRGLSLRKRSMTEFTINNEELAILLRFRGRMGCKMATSVKTDGRPLIG
jgi:hypothetical protein